MFNSIQNKSFLRPLVKTASTAGSRTTAAKSKATSSAGSYFSKALASASKTVTGTLSTKTSASDAKITSRQGSVTGKKTSASASALTDSTAITKLDETKTPVQVLSSALEAIGYNPSQFQMEAHEDFCPYPGPGGGYINKYVSVLLPNGRTENYSTDLMTKYPEIAAQEINRLMTVPLDMPPTQGAPINVWNA